MSVEVTGEDLAAADAVMESVEWQMSNFMPAKGEGRDACRSRRLHAAIAEAIRDARVEAEEAMRKRCAAVCDAYSSEYHEKAQRASFFADAETMTVHGYAGSNIAAAIRSIDTRGE